MSKFVTVTRFSFPYEAQIARSALESAGIEAVVLDEHTINMNWLYSNALGGVRLQVLSNREQEAKELLAQDFSAQVESRVGEKRQTPCPECNSTQWQPYTKGKKPAFLVFLLLGFPLFFYRETVRCSDCGYIK